MSTIYIFAMSDNFKFVRIFQNNDHLWSLRYDEKDADELTLLFRQWSDVNFLLDFFEKNIGDLRSVYHVEKISEAIVDTMKDADILERTLLSMKSIKYLDQFFHPLGLLDNRIRELSREKAKNWNRIGHASWLRVYAIRLEPNVFVITGGAIKLTAKMQDRDHTIEELRKLNRCRVFMQNNGVFDKDSFVSYIEEEDL